MAIHGSYSTKQTQRAIIVSNNMFVHTHLFLLYIYSLSPSFRDATDLSDHITQLTCVKHAVQKIAHSAFDANPDECNSSRGCFISPQTILQMLPDPTYAVIESLVRDEKKLHANLKIRTPDLVWGFPLNPALSSRLENRLGIMTSPKVAKSSNKTKR